MDQIRTKSVFIVIMLVILAVLSTLLWLRFDTSVQAHKDLQNTLMLKQAEQAATGIDELVSEIRNKMSAISLDKLWLEDLSEFAEDDEIQEKLGERFRLYFPKMYSYVITNAHGHQIGGDYNFFIAQVCQADIYNVAKMLRPDTEYFEYEPYIHPKPNNYHFDVMMPVFAKGQEMIFFMSFDAKMLRDQLASRVISDHHMFLVKDDNPTLIEVSTEFVRDQLKRPFHLTDNEMAGIRAMQDVPDTRWRVVVIENQNIMQGFRQQQLENTGLTFVVMLLFWASVLWLGLHHEKSRGKLMHQLNRMSHYDELTKLANRRKLIIELDDAIDMARMEQQCSGVIFIDLNGFKAINDTYGHQAGDEVLKQCAYRLKRLTRQSDLVARLGGDEFLVLIPQISTDENQALTIINQKVAIIERRLSEPYKVGGIQLTCTPSIGVKLINVDDVDVEHVIHAADEKMYEHKKQSKIS